MTRIFDPSLDWNDSGNPVSTGFDDVYYSRQNGLAETDLVFLKGNNLPEAWLNQPNFTIAETGFGTGLNFLATWKLFEETAQNGETLDFISVEQFPMHKDDLAKALSLWRQDVGDQYVDRLLAVYPPRFPGFHRRWISDRVTLTLIFDEALRGFKQLKCPVDAWFLDGFAPKKNPTMWHADLYQEIARLSHSKTTLGSFTAVGNVRRGLAQAGFSVKRAKGFGYKYHRTVATFAGTNEKPIIPKPDNVTIIGTGIAGASCAHALKRKGISVTLIDKNDKPGNEASSNRLGLINPRIEAQDNPRNDAGLSAFSFSNHILQDIPNIGYRQTGALHIGSNDTKKEKLEKISRQNDWLTPHLSYDEKGLFYADAALVNTALLVQTLLKNHTVDTNRLIDENILPDTPTILACGWGLHEFDNLKNLPLQPVRGQVTYATIPDLTMSCPIMFGHYIAPVENNLFSLGASFEQNNDQPILKDSDDADNIAAASTVISSENITITHRWAQIRTASRDRFPIVGKVPKNKNLYVSGALGSHGIQFGLLHAEILACILSNTPLPIGKDALKSLSIERFFQD